MHRYILLIAVLVMSAMSLSACNTVEGFGRDLQEAGRTIDDAID
ncbi:MAG: entericidin A/B family lipoprotein [Bdellovibrionales bacterium]